MVVPLGRPAAGGSVPPSPAFGVGDEVGLGFFGLMSTVADAVAEFDACDEVAVAVSTTRLVGRFGAASSACTSAVSPALTLTSHLDLPDGTQTENVGLTLLGFADSVTLAEPVPLVSQTRMAYPTVVFGSTALTLLRVCIVMHKRPRRGCGRCGRRRSRGSGCRRGSRDRRLEGPARRERLRLGALGRARLWQPTRLGPGRGARARLGQRRRARAWTWLSARQRCRGLANGLRLAHRDGPCRLVSLCRDGPLPGRCLRAIVPAQVDCIGEKHRHVRRVRPCTGVAAGLVSALVVAVRWGWRWPRTCTYSYSPGEYRAHR